MFKRWYSFWLNMFFLGVFAVYFQSAFYLVASLQILGKKVLVTRITLVMIFLVCYVTVLTAQLIVGDWVRQKKFDINWVNFIYLVAQSNTQQTVVPLYVKNAVRTVGYTFMLCLVVIMGMTIAALVNIVRFVRSS